jgi:hypothetical protein
VSGFSCNTIQNFCPQLVIGSHLSVGYSVPAGLSGTNVVGTVVNYTVEVGYRFSFASTPSRTVRDTNQRKKRKTC